MQLARQIFSDDTKKSKFSMIKEGDTPCNHLEKVGEKFDPDFASYCRLMQFDLGLLI